MAGPLLTIGRLAATMGMGYTQRGAAASSPGSWPALAM